MKRVYLCILFAVGSNTAVVPFITPCIWSDSACILSSANKALPYFMEGIKELNIAPIDSVFIKEVIADRGELKLKIEDLKVVGINKAKILKIERDDVKSTLSIILESPIKATGIYTAGGKLFLLDIVGHGDVELKSDKVQLSIIINMKKIDKEGKTYYTFEGYDLKYEILDELFFKFENLFNGDKTKAEPALVLIRENWKFLFPEIARPTIQKITDIEIGAIQKFFESVPVDELELPA